MEQTGASDYRRAEILMSVAVKRSLIPTYEICRLKCEICKRYLSRSPLRVLPNGKTICGRCGSPEGSIQQILLEKLFRIKRFPCIYDKYGCMEIVQFDQLEVHERYCRYRSLKCPLAPTVQCNFEIIITDALDHLWEEHNGYIYGSPITFQIKITETSQHKFITFLDNRIFENVISVCKDRSRIRHDILKDNFPFDRTNYRFFLQEKGNEDTSQVFSGNSLVLPPSTETMQVTLTGLALKETNDALVPRTVCVHCYLPTREYYLDDAKKGWLCFVCAPAKQLCPYSNRGCIHRDRDQNLNKHAQFFCQFVSYCKICKELMGDQSVMDHYNEEHSDIMIPDNKLITLKHNSQKDGWFIVNAVFGKVLCRFQISHNSMIITMYTPLRSDELHNHTCSIVLNNTNLEVCDFNYTCAPPTQYNAIYDWQIQLTGKHFKNVFQNGECTIITKFKKRLPIKTTEWFNDVFQRINEPSQTILLN